MREKLKAIDGQRATFRATFSKYGSRTSCGFTVQMALFVNVRDDHGNEICDHLWLRYGKQIRELQLYAGDEILFEGRATRYVKGYHDDRHVDYCLKNPRNIRKVEQRAVETLPLFRGELPKRFEEVKAAVR